MAETPPGQAPRTAPTTVTGDRLTDDSDFKVVAKVWPEVLEYYPNVTPLITFTSKLRKSWDVDNFKYEHLQGDQYPRTVSVASANDTGVTTVVVATNDYLKLAKNFVLLNTRTREQVLLTENPASASLANVVRGIGGGGAPMAVGDVLEFLAPIHKENDTLGTIKTIKEERLFNYCEILRTPVGWSRRTAGMNYYGGKEPDKLRKKAMFEHKKSIEKRLLFGKRHYRQESDNSLRTFTGGLEYWIKSNIWDLNGEAFTEYGMTKYMEYAWELGDNGYTNGPGIKTALCGREFLTKMQFWANDRIRYEPLSSKIGFRAGQFVSSHGILNLIPHPLLTGQHSGWAWILDMKHCRFVNFKNGKTSLRTNMQDRSKDGYEEEYLTDFGLMLELEAAHGLIRL